MLFDKIQEDLNRALKEKDKVAVSALRMVLASLNNARIAKGADLTDDDAVREVSKDAKRHKESIAAFEAGGRGDLAEKEKRELEVISAYLPEAFSDSELTKMVDEAISALGAESISDLGRVVGAVMSSGGARADGARVSQIARAKLAPSSQP